MYWIKIVCVFEPQTSEQVLFIYDFYLIIISEPEFLLKAKNICKFLLFKRLRCIACPFTIFIKNKKNHSQKIAKIMHILPKYCRRHKDLSKNLRFCHNIAENMDFIKKCRKTFEFYQRIAKKHTMVFKNREKHVMFT